MQTVSERWKKINEKTICNESFVEVSLNITDPEAVSNATSEDNGAIYFSNSTELTNGVDKSHVQYCTLEQNLWCLDGKSKAIPEGDYDIHNGFVSDTLSDDTCIFSNKQPIITINFPHVFSTVIPGITITWSNTYNEYADTFVVKAYNGDTLKAEKEIEGNESVKTLVLTDIIDYDRIEITVIKWCLPNHRARVEEVFLGINKVYGKAELFDYSHIQSVDPISTSLPKSEISFTVDNSKREYDPHNKNGLAKYLTERQEVKSRYGLKLDDGTIEWINGGTFYLSEWGSKQNAMTADFKARDLLEFMSDIYYDDVSKLSYDSLYDLAERVLIAADLPKNSDGSVKWIIDESLREILTVAPLPNDTLANCLELIANIGKCVLYQDREGIIRIEPRNYKELANIDTDYKINRFNSYSKPEITLSKPVQAVRVREYGYFLDGNGEIQSKIRRTLVGERNSIGEIITIDNPLLEEMLQPEITARSSFMRWMENYIKYRMTLDFSWRADPRLDPLDIVINENDSSTEKVLMTEVEYKYNGAFRATGEGKVISSG